MLTIFFLPEVVEPLRRLMVDEVEDEASGECTQYRGCDKVLTVGTDWDESCVSSDPMEANVDIPVMSEVREADVV